MSGPEIELGDVQLSAGWQGIRLLELERHGPEAAPAATLRVVLAERSTGLTPAHVRLDGPRALAYELVFPVDSDGLRAPVIELRLAELGGPGIFYVSLDGPGELTLHPFFSVAEFGFELEAEGPGSGAKQPATEPELEPEPELDLLSKDHKGLMALVEGQLRALDPAWPGRSAASLERVLIEALVHHGDMLSYYQDRVANEAFLDRARSRFSLAQHGRLLGYSLAEDRAASTILGFDVERPGQVPKGLEVRASGGDQPELVYSVRADTPVEPGRSPSALRPAQWPGASSARLPVGARSVIVLGDASALRPGLELALVQGERSCLRRVTRVVRARRPGWVADPNDALTTTPKSIARIHWDAPLEHALDLWDPRAPLELHANLVAAGHGRRARAWLLADSGRPARTDVVLRLDRRNSIIARDGCAGSPRWLLRALELPEGPLFFDRDPQGRVSADVSVEIEGQRWHRQDHLHRSRPFDRHFVVSSDESGRAWLHFGDDRRGLGLAVELDPETGRVGARPEHTLRIDYRVGDPLAGNCGLGRLTQIISPPRADASAVRLAELGSCRVVNVVAGRGGARAETRERARQAIPESLFHGPLTRAVTLDDYARAAEQADPRVERALALELGGVFDTVLVMVDERGRSELSDSLRAEVEAALDDLRMVGREVVVRGPDYVPIEVELRIEASPGHPAHRVSERVIASLRAGQATQLGYFHPDRLSFGVALEAASLRAQVYAIEGVFSVEILKFRRLDQLGGPAVHERIELAATEVARLDDDGSGRARLVVTVTQERRP